MRLESLWLANFPVPDPVERLMAELKEDGEKRDRLISGVASTEILDRTGTVVDYKSLKKAGRGFMKRRNRPMYWNHGWWMPIGRVLSMAFDDETKTTRFSGLIGRDFPVPVAAGTMRFSTQLYNVDQLWSVMEQDLAPADSIAFIGDLEEGKKDKETGEEGPPRLIVSDLLEISVVTIPANSDAEHSVTRALDDPMFVSNIEAGLRSGLLSLDERRMDLKLNSTGGFETGNEIRWALAEEEGDARESAVDDWARIVEGLTQCRTTLRTMFSS